MSIKLRLCFLLQTICIVAYPQSSDAHQIKEERYVNINGIEQWVTIKGDSTQPVMLFVHGGPGSPLSPYTDELFKNWEKDLVLVQWDQRGTARTYGRNAPDELSAEYLKSNPLTLEQITSDGIELVKYLTKRLGKSKVILFGTSWGSVPGLKMAIKNPELFHAFIGHSQIVNPSASNLFAYQTVYQLAQNEKDQEALAVLDLIGKPPYSSAKNAGQLMRVIKKYQRKSSTPAPASWFLISPAYDNEKDSIYRSDGDDYSFVNYAGDKRLEVASVSSTINFLEDGLVFGIPVYFIQGEEDIQTPAVINKAYFEKIKAPQKKFISLPKTAHGFNESVLEAIAKILKEEIVPAINRK